MQRASWRCGMNESSRLQWRNQTCDSHINHSQHLLEMEQTPARILIESSPNQHHRDRRTKHTSLSFTHHDFLHADGCELTLCRPLPTATEHTNNRLVSMNALNTYSLRATKKNIQNKNHQTKIF